VSKTCCIIGAKIVFSSVVFSFTAWRLDWGRRLSGVTSNEFITFPVTGGISNCHKYAIMPAKLYEMTVTRLSQSYFPNLKIRKTKKKCHLTDCGVGQEPFLNRSTSMQIKNSTCSPFYSQITYIFRTCALLIHAQASFDELHKPKLTTIADDDLVILLFKEWVPEPKYTTHINNINVLPWILEFEQR